MGLTPIDVLNSPTRDVYDLYVDVIIHDTREKKVTNQNGKGGVMWVTSKEATWH